MHFSILEQENDLSVSLFLDLAPESSSPSDVTVDDLVFVDPPTPFTQCFELKVGKEFKGASGLDMRISNEVEHHDFDESENFFVHE